MRKIIFKTLFKKELFNILKSVSFWTAFILFYFSLAFGFLALPIWFDMGLSDYSYFFSLFPFVYIIFIPMLTVEIWTDEYKTKTSKLLFLFPISEKKIVLAKFLACLTCFSIPLLASTLIPFSVINIVYFHAFSFLFSYISAFAFGIACISISLGLSAISSESSLAFLFTFLTIAFFSLVHFIPLFIDVPIFIKKFIDTISFNNRFQNATLGILNLGDYIFYFALILFGIELNIYILKLKRQSR